MLGEAMKEIRYRGQMERPQAQVAEEPLDSSNSVSYEVHANIARYLTAVTTSGSVTPGMREAWPVLGWLDNQVTTLISTVA